MWLQKPVGIISQGYGVLLESRAFHLKGWRMEMVAHKVTHSGIQCRGSSSEVPGTYGEGLNGLASGWGIEGQELGQLSLGSAGRCHCFFVGPFFHLGGRFRQVQNPCCLFTWLTLLTLPWWPFRPQPTQLKHLAQAAFCSFSTEAAWLGSLWWLS